MISQSLTAIKIAVLRFHPDFPLGRDVPTSRGARLSSAFSERSMCPAAGHFYSCRHLGGGKESPNSKTQKLLPDSKIADLEFDPSAQFP